MLSNSNFPVVHPRAAVTVCCGILPESEAYDEAERQKASATPLLRRELLTAAILLDQELCLGCAASMYVIVVKQDIVHDKSNEAVITTSVS